MESTRVSTEETKEFQSEISDVHSEALDQADVNAEKYSLLVIRGSKYREIEKDLQVIDFDLFETRTARHPDFNHLEELKKQKKSLMDDLSKMMEEDRAPLRELELSQIKDFFPFKQDIKAQVVEVRISKYPDPDLRPWPRSHKTDHDTKVDVTIDYQPPIDIADLASHGYWYPEGTARKKISCGLRWVHLPGNDMHWFTSIIKAANSNPKDGDPKLPSIMDDHCWTERRSDQKIPNDPRLFSPSMEPYCGIRNHRDMKYEPQIAVYMPYLHWESPYGQKDRREAFNLLAGWYENSLRADEERHNPDPADPDPGIGDGRPRGFDQSENSNYYSSILDTKDRIQNAKDFIGQWKTDRLRSVYPFDDDLPYHSTRTLEQYFCPNVFPAVENDKDNPPDKKLLAVDQLWMVVTGKDTIFTAFPTRAGQIGKEDGASSSVRDGSGFKDFGRPDDDRKHMNELPKCACSLADLRNRIHHDLDASEKLHLDPYETSYTMAAVILHNAVCALMCSKSKNDPNGMSVVATLREKIALLRYRSRDLLRKFIDSEDTITDTDDVDSPCKIYLDKNSIPDELILQSDASAIEEQAKMIGRLLQDQENVVEIFKRKLKVKFLDPCSPDVKRTTEILDASANKIKTFKLQISQVRYEARDLVPYISGILSSKQQTESLREIVNAAKLTKHSVEQGNVMMVFTVVTVIFLPIGFFTSLLGMNIREWNVTNGITLGNFGVFAGVAAIITFVSIVAAFSRGLGYFKAMYRRILSLFDIDIAAVRSRYRNRLRRPQADIEAGLKERVE